MKKLVLFFAVALISFSSFATTNPSNELENSITIEVTSNDQIDVIEFNFDSKEALENFDIDSAVKNLSLDEECTTSISVTVSVGVDSTYVSVTVTAEGIPCDEVVAAIKRLKAQIQSAIE